jgi:hypothetical protein
LIDETVAVVSSILVGLAGGFLSSWMAWNASGEKFDVRKHGNALITGGIVGLIGGAANAIVATDMSAGQFIIQLVFLFGSAIGFDRARSNASDVVGKKSMAQMMDFLNSKKKENENASTEIKTETETETETKS